MKAYVAAPGQHNWPTVPDDVQEHLLSVLTEQLNEDKLKVSLKRPRKKSSETNPIKKDLAVGLRCVLRCLKQNRCSLVLLCSSLSPLILSKPILLLSQLHQVPAIRLKNLSNFLTKLFAIPRCSFLAFKTSASSNPNLLKIIETFREKIQNSRSNSSTVVHFQPGKLVEPFDNPKRVSAGIKKKPKKKR